MRMMPLMMTLLALAGVLSPLPAMAAADTIAAVVNDQVITRSQLEERVALNMRQLGLNSATDAQRMAVMRRTLSGMVDEELQRQFAARVGLDVSAPELAHGRDAVMGSFGGPVAWKKLTQGLERTANDKLRAEILWEKISEQAVRPHVQVGLAEVDKLLEELAKSRHVVERNISMIMLGVGEGKDADKAQLDKIMDIKAQLAKGGDFGALARTYSEDKSASKGGDMGWFSTGELNPQLEGALDKMQPGDVSDPIRTPLGWHLVKLLNARTTKPIDTKPVDQVNLYLLAAALPEGTDADAKTAELTKAMRNATKKLEKPADVEAYFKGKTYAPLFDQSNALGWVVADDLQPALKDAIKSAKTGTWTDKPVTVGKTMGLVYVGGTRTVMPAGLDAYRTRVRENLFNNRAELATRRFMQELRQRAFLDVRL